jgi:methylglutaconyl-CoA hydratase
MSVTLTITKQKVAILTIERAEVHNAFDAFTIRQMIQHIEYANTLDIRALVLTGQGKHFSAGADLNWMKSMVGNTFDENVADSMELARLMQVLFESVVPTICVVQGAAFGGAIGLISCCDIAIAHSKAKFCLSEVKLGLIPAVISPYVIKAIGERQARRYFQTAEVFYANKALDMGLIHEVSDNPEDMLDNILTALLNNGPIAVKQAKQLIVDVANRPIDPSIRQLTAEKIATTRVSDEGQEGLRAFFEKRSPSWHSSQ